VTSSSTLDLTLTRGERIELLQAMADPVRWAVLEELADTTRCVCDIRERVPVAANLLSYHLKVLRDAGLVTATRRGRWIDYAIADDARERMLGALPGARVDARA
jgi:ArsR family transcriptional regulator